LLGNLTRDHLPVFSEKRFPVGSDASSVQHLLSRLVPAYRLVVGGRVAVLSVAQRKFIVGPKGGIADSTRPSVEVECAGINLVYFVLLRSTLTDNYNQPSNITPFILLLF
jgi:hypothetical protein